MSPVPFFRSIVGTLLVLLVSGFAVGGCQSESGPGTLHPQADRVPHYHDTDHTIRSRSSAEAGLIRQLKSALASPSSTIGTRGGGGPEMFGDIGDIVLDRQGRVLVFDGENKEVRLFGTKGAFVASFGRKGEGPGEFASSAQLALLGSGALAVVERASRAQIFEASGKTYERVGGFTVNLSAEDVCALDDTLFVHDLRWAEPENSIYAYTRNGERLGAMGPVYRTKSNLVKGQVTDGRLACDRATGTIVFAFERAPILYGYAPDGTLRWTTRIRPFDPAQVKRVTSENGAPAVRYPSTPRSDRIQSLVDVPGPGVIAQRVRTPPKDGDATDVSIHTYWVSAHDGTGSYVGATTLGDSSAAMIRSVTKQYLVSTQPIPFPKVHVHSVRGVDWEGIGSSDR